MTSERPAHRHLISFGSDVRQTTIYASIFARCEQRNMQARLRGPAYVDEEEEEEISPISRAVVMIILVASRDFS